MDEPCSALDPISTLAIEDLISELKQDYTIVIVTHNMQQAARVSDQTAFFNLEATGKPGRLIEIDDTEKIFSNPNKRPRRITSPAGSVDPHYGVSTTRVPGRFRAGPRVGHVGERPLLGLDVQLPGSDHRKEPGQTLVAGAYQHLERHTAHAHPGQRDAGAAQGPAGTFIVGPAIAPIWTNRWVERRRPAAVERLRPLAGGHR